MEIKKIYKTEYSSFNRIIIRPIVSDIFIKSVSVITIDGEYQQLDVAPFVLDEDTSIPNPIANCTAISMTVEHEFAVDELTIDDIMIVDVSRSSTYTEARLVTKPVRIGVKSYVSPIIKIENNSNVIISANVGIVGYSEDDIEVFNESVLIGLGDSREVVSDGDTVCYEASGARYIKGGIESDDIAEIVNGKIQKYDSQALYLYKPEYLNNHASIKLTEYISIDNNNNIIIKDGVVKYAKCSIRADILDVDGVSPIIKYIGVISR